LDHRVSVAVLDFFFFQAEDGIRDKLVTGVQTCALPISHLFRKVPHQEATSVAEKVCAFYEDYPYPPPVDDLQKYQAWQDPQKQRAEHHLLWPSRPFGQDQSILVAGCGTSQAAKHAMRWPAAKVTGIDFSATSVR